MPAARNRLIQGEFLRKENLQIWQESDDGRSRFEGELFWNGIKYEFELDAQTGIIFDWNADMRE